MVFISVILLWENRPLLEHWPRLYQNQSLSKILFYTVRDKQRQISSQNSNVKATCCHFSAIKLIQSSVQNMCLEDLHYLKPHSETFYPSNLNKIQLLFCYRFFCWWKIDQKAFVFTVSNFAPLQTCLVTLLGGGHHHEGFCFYNRPVCLCFKFWRKPKCDIYLQCSAVWL